jgi:hypothetical protein
LKAKETTRIGTRLRKLKEDTNRRKYKKEFLGRKEGKH